MSVLPQFSAVWSSACWERAGTGDSRQVLSERTETISQQWGSESVLPFVHVGEKVWDLSWFLKTGKRHFIGIPVSWIEWQRQAVALSPLITELWWQSCLFRNVLPHKSCWTDCSHVTLDGISPKQSPQLNTVRVLFSHCLLKKLGCLLL